MYIIYMDIITAIMNDPFLNDSRVWWTLISLILSVFMFVGFAIRNIECKASWNEDENDNDDTIKPILSKSQKDRLSTWETAESEPLKVVEKQQVNLADHENNEDHDQLPELIPSDAPDVDKEKIEAAINKAVKTKPQEGEEGLAITLQRINNDEKIKAFIEGKYVIFLLCAFIYSNTYLRTCIYIHTCLHVYIHVYI